MVQHRSILRPARTPRWIQLIAPVPNPCATYDEWEQLQHLDLPVLTMPELLRQQRCIRYRLDLDPSPPMWLFERRQAITSEVHRRERSR